MQITSGRMLRGTGLGSDLLLKPPTVPGMGLLAFKLGRAQEQAGYEYTLRFLDKAGGLDGINAWRRGEVMPGFED